MGNYPIHLSPNSLRQLDQAYLDALEEAALRVMSSKLLEDLKEAWDRLNQGSENNARSPNPRASWERWNSGRGPAEEPEDGELEPEVAESNPAEAKPAEAKAVEAKPAAEQSAWKVGQQPGVPGIGRTQVFQAHDRTSHR